MEATKSESWLSLARKEGPFFAGAVTMVLFLLYGKGWLADLSNPWISGLIFVWVFAAMLWGAFGVVRHADCLADLLGEPYGTLILTVAVITIEVALISAVMLAGENNPTLARDTMLAVIMIVLNLMIGLALLIGGGRHGEQEFNLQGARAYLGVLLPLATMSMILPRFTQSTADATLTPFQEVMFATFTILLYATFLAIQTVRHRSFFMEPADLRQTETGEEENHGHGHPTVSTPYHAIMLILTLVPIVILSKKLAVLVEFGIESLGAPAALGGILVAILVLAPEGLAALEAAGKNRLQRSVNICLGSALATISLTVPAVMVISLVTAEDIILGVGPAEMALLILTLGMSMLTFGGVKTNMLQGAAHLVVFLAYLVLVFNP
ncbi:calcium:proton antiporter [Amorphus orientalis]|uniref:Ca2+:H+ antiporter n=1 Tax=Amorphus orientalis TaxID=649198 RepID=A0AAE3VL54_9HYPH|nr:calcium:proton antiporter [Amorphus orientalis]MDQ0314030.1 Ca2+:H+ antiporter [Amorphus orientalis]